MKDRLVIQPDPTPLEYEVVATALAEAEVEDGGDAVGSAWRQAGVEESVDRAPQVPSLRSSRGATRA
jgi:hypothetical protein